MAEAKINPAILIWARERAGMSIGDVASRIGTRDDKVAGWEAGESLPTFRQARLFAEATHIPFGYLYLVEPPDDPLPIADFRTLGDRPVQPLGLAFRDVLNDVLRKQSWYREYRQSQGYEALPFVGRFAARLNPGEIAEDIRATLGIMDLERQACPNWEGFLKLLTEKIETAGVLVMRSGIVGNNTHRPLSVEEFRGFVISDPIAPVIFINGKDARAAQIFTLVHELAHVWVGATGVSNEALDVPVDGDPDVERVCNEAAAQFLVPRQEVTARWDENVELDEQARQLSRHFRVSTVVIARRAAELGLTTWEQFFAFYGQEREAWRNARQQEGGGDFYRTSATRNSKTLTKAVLATAFEGKLLLRDAGRILGVAPSKLKQLASTVYGE